jgi:hypothetical protein
MELNVIIGVLVVIKIIVWVFLKGKIRWFILRLNVG